MRHSVVSELAFQYRGGNSAYQILSDAEGKKGCILRRANINSNYDPVNAILSFSVNQEKVMTNFPFMSGL